MKHLLIPILTILAMIVLVMALQRYELRKFRRTATTMDRCIYADRSYLIVKATKDQVAIEMRQNFPIWVSRSDIYPAFNPDKTK